jgi:hypothetical protein
VRFAIHLPDPRDGVWNKRYVFAERQRIRKIRNALGRGRTSPLLWIYFTGVVITAGGLGWFYAGEGVDDLGEVLLAIGFTIGGAAPWPLLAVVYVLGAPLLLADRCGHEHVPPMRECDHMGLDDQRRVHARRSRASRGQRGADRR